MVKILDNYGAFDSQYMHRGNAIARQLFMLETQIRVHMKAKNIAQHITLDINLFLHKDIFKFGLNFF